MSLKFRRRPKFWGLKQPTVENFGIKISRSTKMKILDTADVAGKVGLKLWRRQKFWILKQAIVENVWIKNIQ